MKEIVLGASKKFYGLSKNELHQIRQSLTLPNPAFAKAQKYSPYSRIAVPECLYFYTDHSDYIETPLGFEADFDRLDRFNACTLTDIRVDTVLPKLDPFLLELRPTQIQARDAFLSLHRDNPLCQQGVICLSTGLGKSATALSIAHSLRAKTLIIVHKDDLVVGWRQDIKKFLGNVDVGLIKAGKKKIGEFITIATPQTLNRLPDDFKQELFNTFSLVIHDELHHVASTHFSISAQFNSRYKLGLTATPERNDGLTKVINFYYGEMCYYDKTTSSNSTILPVAVKINNVNSVKFNPNCSVTYNNKTPIRAEIKGATEDVEEGDIRFNKLPPFLQPSVHYSHIDKEVVLNENFGEQVLKDVMKEYDAGRSIVMFISQKEVCEIYYDNLVELVGEDKVQLFYGNSKESNEELMRRAEEREALITITTLAKGTEGTNVRSWEVAFLISSMNNGVGVEQAIGRIRRAKKGKISPCIVYDYRFPNVPQMSRHGATRDKRYRDLGFSMQYLNAPEYKKRTNFR